MISYNEGGCQRSTRIDGGVSGENKVGNPCYSDICLVSGVELSDDDGDDRLRYPKPVQIFHVSLKVGEREFFGEGETMQAARHCAATRALGVLRTLPLPTREPAADSVDSETVDETPSRKGCVRFQAVVFFALGSTDANG